MYRILYFIAGLLFFNGHLNSSQPPYRLTSTISKETKARAFSPKDLPIPIKSGTLTTKAFIVIDPGHGGKDVGAQSISKPRYQEKSLNLVTALFLKSYLDQLGYHTEMTRHDDTFMSLERRALFANDKKPDLFVSIHYNSAPSSEAQGIEVFYFQEKDNKERVAASKQLAKTVLKCVLNQTKANSRGVKQGNFAVIRQTKMPAILVEGGFLTNEAELQKIKDPAYLKRIAWGVAKGVDEYLNKLNQK